MTIASTLHAMSSQLFSFVPCSSKCVDATSDSVYTVLFQENTTTHLTSVNKDQRNEFDSQTKLHIPSVNACLPIDDFTDMYLHLFVVMFLLE